MCLHEKIKLLCEKKKISIYQMCKDTGINQNTVCNWKDRPDARPSLQNALALSKYFDVPVEHFIKED